MRRRGQFRRETEVRQDAADDLGLLDQRDRAQPPAAAIARQHIKPTRHGASRDGESAVAVAEAENSGASDPPTGGAAAWSRPPSAVQVLRPSLAGLAGHTRHDRPAPR
jgi:hypothetical protein